MNYEEIEKIKAMFPKGTRINLINMQDGKAVPPDTTGTVDYVDDAGIIQMKWDNGSNLGLLYGVDEFEVVKKIRCLLVKPNQLPEEVYVYNDLKSLQLVVDGNIECVYLQNDDNVLLICNDEAKINGMELNRYIGYDIIAGQFLIVGDDYDNADFKSLTDDQITKYKEKFDKRSIEKTSRVIASILGNKNIERNEER